MGGAAPSRLYSESFPITVQEVGISQFQMLEWLFRFPESRLKKLPDVRQFF
jgi:hypothetical protein